MLHRNAIKHARPGFTLIETIAAIVILSVAMPALLWTVNEAHVQRVNPVLISKARWLAVERLEDIIADRNSTTRGYDHLVIGNYPTENQVADFEQFSRSVALQETEADLATPGNGYMTATVNVSWTDAGAATRSLSISTVLTEYAP